MAAETHKTWIGIEHRGPVEACPWCIPSLRKILHSDAFAHPARGKILTGIASDWGIKRRWFGLEPDRLLRQRVREAILSTAK